jgi:cytochrome d ubiquinol oxidase subunit II
MSAERFVLDGIGLGLVAYALTGGADFGGGMWDLLARGPRAPRQRALVERSIAPIWEANHIWLIFVTVLCFTVFPRAFAVLATAFHVPLLLALLGIVLRGAAFTFRAYGMEPAHRRALWQHVFASASAVTPLFLGMVVAGLASGGVRIRDGVVVSPLTSGWTTPFAFAVGAFTVALCAMLAAVYLCVDAVREREPELAEDFRRRAIASELVAGALAMAALWRASVDAPELFDRLLGNAWSMPVQVATAGAAAGVIAALWRRRYGAARLCVAAQVVLVIVGWGLAMGDDLVLGAVSLHDAGARAEVMRPLAWVLGIGALALAPALVVLFRVFKARDGGKAD